MDEPAQNKTGLNRAEGWWLAGLMLLAFLVRWAPSLYPHFWFDEIFTIALASKPFGEILRLTAADMHPPLYYDWIRCFTLIGSRLGGPFATLAWLRLASIGPGMATCALGWWAARRYWGRSQAIWTLAGFAVAPALTFFSVELRCYSTLHALLLGAFYGLLRATEPRPEAPRGPGLLLLGGCALVAFYTHSLSTLYLGGFGLIFLAELGQARAPRRRELARRGALLLAVLAVCCAPWLWLMIPQTASLNEERWLSWADWPDLRATFFWYMPLGPLNKGILERSWRLLIMLAMSMAIVLLLVNAWRHRRQPLPAADAGAPPLPLCEDRLLIYSGLMTIIPVLVSFVLSYFHIAKTFLGFRYNLIPAPFIVLALIGLTFRIADRRCRLAALATLLAIRLLCSGLLIRQRLNEDDIIGQAAQAKPEILRPDSRLVWNNPMVVPWLGMRRGPHRIRSIDEILAGQVPLNSHETIYVLTHIALDFNYCGLLHRPSYLLKEVMKRQGIPRERIQSGAWDAVWRLTPADLPPLIAAVNAARDRIRARRNAIKGGQVVLADEELFTINGWGPLQYGPDLFPERWTLGLHQKLSWSGPRHPGHYRLKLHFRRPHPYPEKDVTVRYRLPGQRKWRSQTAGPGQVTLEGEIRVKHRGQRLHIHLETPTWIPMRYLENTLDDRRLGMLFQSLELFPIAAHPPGAD